MITPEAYADTVSEAVMLVAQKFSLTIRDTEGNKLFVPCSYQIEEPGFRPFKSGKASPEELQEELDTIVGHAVDRNVDLGIEDEDSARKLFIQNGLGIDCSNLALRTLIEAHEQLGLEPYVDTIYRPAPDIQRLHTEKESWKAKTNKQSRDLTQEEAEKLYTSEHLSIGWIAEVFGKDPEFIAGSSCIADEKSAVRINDIDILPGDILAFTKTGKGVVSHVAIVEGVEHFDRGGIDVVNFWHSWHTRDFNSGVRRDKLTIDNNTDDVSWSHPGLGDPSRYEGHFFARPNLMNDLLTYYA